MENVTMKNEYNSYFFNEFQKVNGGNNYMDEEKWVPFFQRVAQRIVDLFNPTTVLDAGCACGYLVAALRDLGVQAYGFDISKYAISKVREDVQEFCFEHSITKPLPSRVPETYDLVVVTEVLEHLFPEEGELAIENLCKYSDTIVFSSTPSDVEDRTHVNVQQPEYWAEMFYNNSFAKNFIFDMTTLSPWCVVYEKFSDMKKLVFNYELNMRIDKLVNEKNLNHTINALMETLLSVDSKVFFDDSTGFVEERSVTVPQKLDESTMSVTVEIPENTVSIRFDPVQDQYCMLKNIEIYLDNKQVTSFTTNGEIVGNYVLFNNLEPQIIIEGVSGKKELKIYGKFQHMEEDFLLLYQAKNASVDFTIADLNSRVEKAELISQQAEDIVAERDAQLLEKDKIASSNIVALTEKNEMISKRDTALVEKDNLLAQKETELLEKTAKLTEKESALEKVEDELSGKDDEIEEKVSLLEAKEAELAEKIEELEAKIQELEELSALVSELENTVAEKDAVVVRQDFELTEKDELITAKEATITEKESMVSQLDEELYQKNTRMVSIDNQLKMVQEDSRVAREQVVELGEKLEKLQNSYDSMRESSAWKLVAPFYKDPNATPKEKGKKDPKAKKEKEVKAKKDPKEKKEKATKETKAKKEPKGKKETASKKEPAGKKAKQGKGKKQADKDESVDNVEEITTLPLAEEETQSKVVELSDSEQKAQ